MAVAVKSLDSIGGRIGGSVWNAPSSLCHAAITCAIAAVTSSGG